MVAKTPKPPYYAVIFTNIRSIEDPSGYGKMSKKMENLVTQQPGYLGHESAKEELGITVSYWESEDAIANWKRNAEHQFAQKYGMEKWYQQFCTRVCKVERDNHWNRK